MKQDQTTDHVLHEITPLRENDIMYIADRHKKEFTYPIHNHQVFELNFVEHAAGVRRIVGDSNEVIGEYDLVLITSLELEHVWMQNDCKSDDIHEITVQFRFDLSEEGFFGKSAFKQIFNMLNEARKGLVFSMNAIMKVYNQLQDLSSITDRFEAFISFLRILNTLATCEGSRTLATSSYAKVVIEEDSSRILKVKNYINTHYMDDLKLGTLSELACMSETAFSRFFKLHTGRTVSDYIIDIRLGFAARMLVDTSKTIADICYLCGYNNLSNFNRVFKRKKGCAPTEFREYYHKTKIIV